MTNPVIFDFDEQSVRATTIDGEPWFVGKDVCRCLGLENSSQALSRLDEDERKGVIIGDPLGKNPQQMICVNEPGVYNLVFTSRTEAATKFKRWLAHEVLPALRRTGSYNMGDSIPASGLAPATVTDPDAVDMLDLDDLRKCYAILDVHRRLFGRRAAADLARRLPIPREALAVIPTSAEGPVGRFLADRMQYDPEARVEFRDLWQAYLDWCRHTGEVPLSQTAFGRGLGALGLIRVKSNGRIWREGIRAPRHESADEAA